MKQFLIKHKLLTLILLLIVLVVAWIVYRTGKVPVMPLPTPENSWKNIVPGTSLLKDVNIQLGEPVSSDNNQYEYSSDNPNLNHEVLYENNVVVSIRRIAVIEDQMQIKGAFAQHGQNFTVLYSDKSTLGDNLYVYLNKGIAYLGNPDTDRVLEVWYFRPVNSVDEFITKYAPDYSLVFPQEGF